MQILKIFPVIFIIAGNTACSMHSLDVIDALHKIAISDHDLSAIDLASMFGMNIAKMKEVSSRWQIVYKASPDEPLTYLWIGGSKSGIGSFQEIRINLQHSLCLTANEFSQSLGTTYREDVNPVHVLDGHGGYLKMMKFGLVFAFHSAEHRSSVTFNGENVTGNSCVSSFTVRRLETE